MYRLNFADAEVIQVLFGEGCEHLQQLAESAGVTINTRGTTVMVEGDPFCVLYMMPCTTLSRLTRPGKCWIRVLLRLRHWLLCGAGRYQFLSFECGRCRSPPSGSENNHGL